MPEEIEASQNNPETHYKVLKKYERTIRMCSAVSEDTENALEILKSANNGTIKKLYEQLKTYQENIKKWKQDLESLSKSTN